MVTRRRQPLIRFAFSDIERSGNMIGQQRSRGRSFVYSYRLPTYSPTSCVHFGWVVNSPHVDLLLALACLSNVV
jgi:hypothetical protein